MYLKIHKIGNETIVAACDKAQIGKVLRKDALVLDLDKFRSFYMGEPCGEKTLISALSECTSANLVGKKAVGAAIKTKLASEGSVLKFGEVPHLQIYRII
jgi:hypothetical protein